MKLLLAFAGQKTCSQSVRPPEWFSASALPRGQRLISTWSGESFVPQPLIPLDGHEGDREMLQVQLISDGFGRRK